MAEKKKRRRFRIPFPKINDDFMTTIVVFSLGYCVRMVEKGLELAAQGLDASATISPALLIFGTELGICGLMKMYERKVAADDRRAEEARERRRKKEEKEAQEKEAYLEGGKRHENE